jgi:threonine dehydratase
MVLRPSPARQSTCSVPVAMSHTLITIDEIRAARIRGAGVVMTTPAFHSNTFSRICGRDIWHKCENLQRAGSFKIRGAMNALSLLPAKDRTSGVVAASAGNHAQGVALAATKLGITSTVFMPEGAPLPKIEATRQYGAEVRLVGANLGESVDAAQEFQTETGATFIHPYDNRDIVTGQGTLGLELLEQIPDASTVVIPIGGGGLAAGTAAALKSVRPEIRIIGVEAAMAATYVASRTAGRPTPVEPRFTLADGIAVSRPSDLVFEHIEAYIDDIVTVDDGQMAEAVAMLLERGKLLVEAAGAAPLAATLADLVGPADGPTVLVLSGGNVDLLLLDQVLRHGLEAAGRYESFSVRVPDVPGHLADVTVAIAAAGANVLSVDHGRQGIGLPFGYTEIRFAVETRSSEQFEAMCASLQANGVEVLR